MDRIRFTLLLLAPTLGLLMLNSCGITVNYQGDERPVSNRQPLQVFANVQVLDALKRPYDLIGYLSAEASFPVTRSSMRQRLIEEAEKHGGDGIVFVDVTDLGHGQGEFGRGSVSVANPNPLTKSERNGARSAKRVAGYIVLFLPATNPDSTSKATN